MMTNLFKLNWKTNEYILCKETYEEFIKNKKRSYELEKLDVGMIFAKIVDNHIHYKFSAVERVITTEIILLSPEIAARPSYVYCTYLDMNKINNNLSLLTTSALLEQEYWLLEPDSKIQIQSQRLAEQFYRNSKNTLAMQRLSLGKSLPRIKVK